MRSILVLNAKGGSGKTTIATNLAVYYAGLGKSVVLVDYDPQCSSTDWLESRPEDRPAIHGLLGWQSGARVPRNTDYVIMDAPAASHGRALGEMLRRAQSCVIPVAPSPIDLNAAARFLDEIGDIARVTNRKIRVGTVANRVRESSPGRMMLEDYLRSIRLGDGRKLPFVSVLRSSQNYLHAAERGLGIFELAPSRVGHDLELWEPLISWLNSKRSLPES